MFVALPRGRLVAVAIVLLAGALAASSGAQEPPPEPGSVVHFFAADATQQGVISLYFFGAQGRPVTFFERVGDDVQPLGVRSSTSDRTELREAVVWRCARRLRRFTAATRLPDGRLATGAYRVRTPSCRTRLELQVPRRLRPGALGRIRIVDRWGNGGISPRLCITPPGGRRTCRKHRMRRAVTVTTRRVRARRTGRWRVELRLRTHRVRRSIAVGSRVGSAAPPPTLLATGDSTMQGLDAMLADELGDRAKVVSDVHPGTGFAKPAGPWSGLPRSQTRRLRQETTVVSLGVVDGFPLELPDKREVECCGPEWTAEYARRVRTTMRTYRRRGRARVVWLTLPIPRGRRDSTDAVNAAVLSAAEGMKHITVLRMDRLFTPDGYRRSMRYRGRVVRVRAEDGVHLTITGQAIATKAILVAMRAR